MAQFLNEEGVYVNPIELISKKEYVKAYSFPHIFNIYGFSSDTL